MKPLVNFKTSIIPILTVLYLSNLTLVKAQSEKTDLDKIEYKAIYKLLFHPDTTNRNIVIKNERILYLGKESSTFMDKNTVARDSFLTAVIGENPEPGSIDHPSFSLIGMPRVSYTGRIFKDRKSKEISVYENVFKNYVYYENGDINKWVLKDSILKIGIYQCQKAETDFRGRHYNAWFTTEIPIGDGPYKFYGLPGLIIKIGDSNEDYVFELTSFGNASGELSKTLNTKSKPTLTNMQEMNKMKRNMLENSVEMAAQNGITLGDAEAAKVRNREILKHSNNPIELTEQ